MKIFSLFLALLNLISFTSFAQAEAFDPSAFHSQASQDKFIHTILYSLEHKSDQGYYLEIGAGHPRDINNSYFLEKRLGWQGISLDISDYHKNEWFLTRKNQFLVQDALQCDFRSLLSVFPPVIDYLSLDIDGLYDVVLMALPLDTHLFRLITIEHDSYRFGDVYKNNERAILEFYGYRLLCADVHCQGLCFEDWWVHPDTISADTFAKISSLDLNGKDHLQIIETLKNLQ